MTRRNLGVILILGSTALALDQLIRFHGWEWQQMYTLWHHEGLSLAGLALGAACLLRARRQA